MVQKTQQTISMSLVINLIIELLVHFFCWINYHTAKITVYKYFYPIKHASLSHRFHRLDCNANPHRHQTTNQIDDFGKRIIYLRCRYKLFYRLSLTPLHLRLNRYFCLLIVVRYSCVCNALNIVHYWYERSKSTRRALCLPCVLRTEKPPHWLGCRRNRTQLLACSYRFCL